MNVQVKNKYFQNLVRMIQEGEFLFPFSIKDKRGVHAIREIRRHFLDEKNLDQSVMVDLIERCLFAEGIQKALRLNKPQIVDYSEVLHLRKGRVYGLEFQKMGPTGSHKDLMIGALIIIQIMAGLLPRGGIDTITDAGFVNSALAAKFYTDYLGFQGTYFIQETVPKWLLEQLDDSDHFEAVRVPVPASSTGVDKKNATYRALLRKFVVDSNFKDRACHLGHAEIGPFAMMPYGRMFARLLEKMDIKPSVFLTPVGAGTTIMGI